jgi:hypothetical protein
VGHELAGWFLPTDARLGEPNEGRLGENLGEEGHGTTISVEPEIEEPLTWDHRRWHQ